MKKCLITFLTVSLMMFSSFTAVYALTKDEAVISAQDDKYTPLYTTSPDSSLKDYTSSDLSTADYRLFYTQTTFLALIAGYLILFKVKGVKRNESHRR